MQLDELVVKISADVAELKTGFSEGASAVGSGIAQINSNIDQLVSNSQKAGSAFHDAWHTALGVFEGEALLEAVHKIGELVTETFHEIVTESINDAAAFDTALNRMNNALALAGHYSKEASDEMKEFAEALSKSSTYSGQAVLGASALIETLGKLDEEALKKATQGAADLSAALGIDLETAARLVGKAAAGNVDTFSRFGLKIETGATAAETFANAMDAINSKFGGSAAAQVETYSGALAQLHNASEASHEALGAVVVQNQAVIESIKAVTSIIGENAEGTKKNQQAWKEFVGEALIVTIDILAGVVSAFDAVARVGEISFYGIRGAIETVSLGIITLIDGPIALLYKGLSQLPGVGDQFAKKFDAIVENAAGVAASINKDAANIEAAINNPTAAGKKFEEQLLKIRDAAATGLAAVRSGADATIEPTNRATAAVRALSAENEKLAEEGAKLAKKALEEDDPKRKYNDQVKALDAAHKQMKLSDADYAKSKELLWDEVDAKLTEDRKQEYEQLDKDNKALIAMDANKNREAINENKARINEILAAEEAGSSLSIEIQKREHDEKKKMDDALHQAEISTLNNFASFQNSKSKELGAIGKAAATASATIQAYLGATAAMASAAQMGPPGLILGPIAAGSFLAAGLANVANIAGVELATGIDTVPGAGIGDSFHAVLEPGERVIPKDSNRKIDQFFSGNNRMVEMLKAIHDRLGEVGQAIAQQKTVVNVGGKTVVDTLRREIRGGRSFAA
jgi:hypothetical protein